jgi:Fe-S-cluster containining protein
MARIACFGCGVCCVAPDIAALGKALGRPCPHLQADLKCAVYADRPQVCRDYSADELCLAVDAPTLDERVARYLALFALDQP